MDDAYSGVHIRTRNTLMSQLLRHANDAERVVCIKRGFAMRVGIIVSLMTAYFSQFSLIEPLALTVRA